MGIGAQRFRALAENNHLCSLAENNIPVEADSFSNGERKIGYKFRVGLTD